MCVFGVGGGGGGGMRVSIELFEDDIFSETFHFGLP